MSGRPRPRVVLVDDYADLITAWRRVLAPTCDIVGSASNARGAVELAASLQPDVMVLDHLMPGRTGLDVSDDIRQASPQTRIILVTAADDLDGEGLTARAGIAEVVHKFSGAAELERAIQRAASDDALGRGKSLA